MFKHTAFQENKCTARFTGRQENQKAKGNNYRVS